ncbi:macrophage mannose receptor 1-like, partial [Clarias magur]
SSTGPDRFVGITNPMLNWSEAQAYCREFYTDLASSTNSIDNNLLAQVASHNSICYWFGLYRDTWKWSDGTSVSNLQWATGQPDNLYKPESCGINYQLLEDEKCNNQHIFMCHT